MTDEENTEAQQETFKGKFRPTASRLKEITERGVELLANIDEGEFGEFVECDVEADESDSGQ